MLPSFYEFEKLLRWRREEQAEFRQREETRRLVASMRRGPNVPDADEVRQILRRSDELWRMLRASVEARPEAELVSRRIAGEWTGKDVLAHVARWHDAARAVLTARERRPAVVARYEDEEALNAQWAQEDRAVPLWVARERSEASYRDLRAVLRGLEARGWDGVVVDWVRGATWAHYAAHIADLPAR